MAEMILREVQRRLRVLNGEVVEVDGLALDPPAALVAGRQEDVQGRGTGGGVEVHLREPFEAADQLGQLVQAAEDHGHIGGLVTDLDVEGGCG